MPSCGAGMPRSELKVQAFTVNNLTPEIKRYIAGGGHALFALSLFFAWSSVSVGALSASASGWSVLPSGWLWFVAAAAVALIVAADAFRFDLPPFLNINLATLLSGAIAFYMLATLFEGPDGTGFGYWLGLIGSLAGFAMLMIIRHEEA